MSSNNKKFKLLEKPAVYIVTSDDVQNLYKIGLTKNIMSRMRSYHTSIPGNVQIIQICYFNHLNAMKIAEKLLHFTLSNYREQDNKEWFRTENSELFIKMLKKITRFINSIAPEDEEDDEDEEEDDEDEEEDDEDEEEDESEEEEDEDEEDEEDQEEDEDDDEDDDEDEDDEVEEVEEDEDLSELKKTELQDMCRLSGLKITGTKLELIDILLEKKNN